VNRLSFAILLSLVPVAACHDEIIDPYTTPTSTTTVPSGEPTGGAPPQPGPKVRDVYQRNPFGVPLDNLLADGDFELSITRQGTGQYGWRLIHNGDLAPMPAETGGICKSGLRCGRIDSNDILYATGTTAPGEAEHHASIWLKALEEPPDPKAPCELADVFIFRCGANDVIESLEPAPLPDQDGWCQYQADVESSKVAICMYVDVGSSDVLVDNAVLVAAPSKSKSPPPPSPAPPKVKMRPGGAERFAAVIDLIRRTRRFGSGPDTPAPFERPD
jgi:hypothetical protein